MSGRIESLAATLAARRVEAALSAIAEAELPAGLSAVRDGDAVVIRGRGLVRALAGDARLRGLAGGLR